MSRAYLLNGHTTNTRGTVLNAAYDGQYQPERRVWIEDSSTIGGATVYIDIRSAGDTAWKHTGVQFTAATDYPKLIDIQPGDEISAIVSGGTGANITVGIC